MSSGPSDAKWPKLLSLTVHEFRSPLTVVSGYIRMLLKERAGPLPDQQRRLLEEAEKSCARLSVLLGEVSELSQLEARTAPFDRAAVDVGAVLGEVVSALPNQPDRTVVVELQIAAAAPVNGDAARLRTAFTSILLALRRELVTSDRLTVDVGTREDATRPSLRITVGELDRIDQLRALGPAELTPFDEWRGGNGLSLVNARRIVEAHEGQVWSPVDDSKAAAVIDLPTTPFRIRSLQDPSQCLESRRGDVTTDGSRGGC
jgi:signal transduction histidine kinase